LSATDIEAFGREIEAIRDEVLATRGPRDRAYILRMIRVQRALDLVARVAFLACAWTLPELGLPWSSRFVSLACLTLGVALLALAKTLENMEIAHNVMHAQWDWMHDPTIQSSTWEWDSLCPSEYWKHSHNVVHHTWTNVVGRDPDVGYAFMRVTPRQPWQVKFLPQALWHALLMMFFDGGVAVHDLDIEKLATGQRRVASIVPMLHRIWWKASRMLLKDYVLWPALGSLLVWLAIVSLGGDSSAAWRGMRSAYGTLLFGIWVANVVRNVWSSTIVFCGHFPMGVYHFTEQDLVGETRARWYVRQLLGSCNISGGKLLHILTGNLSHQIEHHLYPDMPSNRYADVAPRIAAIAARYGLPYHTGSLARQVGRMLWTIWRLSFPGGELAQSELAGRSAGPANPAVAQPTLAAAGSDVGRGA
jgi:linoleoyl-CoA desaturase